MKTRQKNTKLCMRKQEAEGLCMLYIRTGLHAHAHKYIHNKQLTPLHRYPNSVLLQFPHRIQVTPKLIVWFTEPYGIRTIDLSNPDSVNSLLSTRMARGLVGISVGTGPVSCTTRKFRLYRLINKLTAPVRLITILICIISLDYSIHQIFAKSIRPWR